MYLCIKTHNIYLFYLRYMYHKVSQSLFKCSLKPYKLSWGKRQLQFYNFIVAYYVQN